MDQLFDIVVTSLWAPATYAKMLFLLVTAPFWFPLARIMYRELIPALGASEDEQAVRRPPGQDPFLSIPLASHRARRAAATGAVRARRAR
ncbi:MAG TPA: hypothetical protein VF530_06585 [Planctomycetota bacterium]